MSIAKKTSRKIILVIGGVRSGKSELAENLAIKMAEPIIYIATAIIDSSDPEWCDRIEKHRQRRPQNWQTKEVPVDLSATIDNSFPPNCLLVDSLGSWVANLLSQEEEVWKDTQEKLIQSLEETPVKIVLVAEETGWGVIPSYPLGRLFRDRLGSLVRQIGEIADIVYLVVGGYGINLTEIGQPLSILIDKNL